MQSGFERKRGESLVNVTSSRFSRYFVGLGVGDVEKADIHKRKLSKDFPRPLGFIVANVPFSTQPEMFLRSGGMLSQGRNLKFSIDRKPVVATK